MNKKAFTLIEVLVVVLIIGILAAIAVPQYQKAVDKTRFSALMNITRALADANERFYLANGKYSTNFEELDINIPATSISGAIAYFDWGNCRLITQQEVQCTDNTHLKNEYVIHYSTSPIGKPNHIECHAPSGEANKRYNELCQSMGTFDINTTCYIGPCNVYTMRS